jgi:S1-C subfamily serine protease
MQKFLLGLLILFIINAPASAQWRGGEGGKRVGTGLRDAIGSNSGQWYATGALDWVAVVNLAKQRAKANGHPGRFEAYLVRFMPEPSPLQRTTTVNNSATVPPPPPPPESSSLGVQVSEFDDGDRKGLLVTKVVADSPATRLMREGAKGNGILESNIHVILELNGEPVTTLAKWKREMAQAGDIVNLLIFNRNTDEVRRYKANLNETGSSNSR